MPLLLPFRPRKSNKYCGYKYIFLLLHDKSCDRYTGLKWLFFHYFVVRTLIKSVQSALSHLQSPPLNKCSAKRNYGSFVSKSHLHSMILLTMLAPNRPKSKRQYFNRAICYFKIVKIKQGEAPCDMVVTWQVLILKAVLH